MVFCFGISLTVGAQSTIAKQKAKQLQKEYKQKVKEYTKDGWKVYGNSNTLDMALLNHYEAMEKENVSEIISATRTNSPNAAIKQMQENAAHTYAQNYSSMIRGRITEEVSSNINNETIEEFENFYAAFENNLQKEIQGNLQRSYAISRQITLGGKKVYEYQAIFLLNEDAASKARIKALENALKESKLAQEHAKMVSEFINEPYEK